MRLIFVTVVSFLLIYFFGFSIFGTENCLIDVFEPFSTDLVFKCLLDGFTDVFSGFY